MAVYFVTGKLGSGKTLSAVGRIRDYLAQGRPVATNLDIDLVKLCGPKAKTPVLYRLPDKPALIDLQAIGSGNLSYDESRNGLVVLDECGTWFNSRTWGDKERQSIINWFLHARKLGWDIIFIVQSIAIVDKQARLTLAEHVVYCRRLDKITIPFISPISKLLTGKPLRLPRIHMAIVKYGDQPTSLTVDRWFYLGRDLYSAYDTKQAFSDFYDKATHQLFTPWTTHGRHMVPMNAENIMRLSKIYWKRFNRPALGGLAFAAGIALAVGLRQFPEPLPVVAVQEAVAPVDEFVTVLEESVAMPVKSQPEPEPVKQRPVHDRFQGHQISGILKSSARTAYLVRSPSGQVSTMHAGQSGQFDILAKSDCHIRLISSTDLEDFVDLYAGNCAPVKLPTGSAASSEPAIAKVTAPRLGDGVRREPESVPLPYRAPTQSIGQVLAKFQ